MAITNSFKQYSRGTRQQLTEANFKGGIEYSDAPLQEGKVRALVNFDIDNFGTKLYPRAGLRVNSRTTSEDPLTVSDDYIISDSAESHSEGEMCTQYVLTNPEKNCLVTTVFPDGTQTFSKINNIKAKVVEAEQTQIHNIPINGSLSQKQIGAFAWNDSYHFFDQDGQLRYTKFNKTQTDSANRGFNIEAPLVPKNVSPSEARSWGYNMLLPEPYEFTCQQDPTLPTDNLTFTGAQVFDAAGEHVVTNLKTNIEYTYKFYFKYNQIPTNCVYDIEWREVQGPSWEALVKNKPFATGSVQPVSVSFSSPVKHLMLRIIAKVNTGGGDVKSVYALSVTFDEKDQVFEIKNYDLSTSTCMTYFKNRLWLAGTAEDPSILFASQIDNAEYFPYPNNTHFFEDPIIALVPFLDKLLVFTTTSIHQILMDETGMSWSVSCLQEHLHLKAEEVPLIQVVKNMIYFKSGDGFYMIVPKANSLTGALTLAPISRSIQNLLCTFKEAMEEILEATYGHPYKIVSTIQNDYDISLKHYYNYLNYEYINNIYTFQTKKGLYINVNLMYNSIIRYWKTNIVESSNILYPTQNDATKQAPLGSLIYLGEGPLKSLRLQFLDYDKNNLTDLYYAKTITALTAYPVEASYTKNYQYLDTGFREHNSQLKKRYRELQFMLEDKTPFATVTVDPEQTHFKFYTGFLIDNDVRKLYFKYTPTVVPETNEITIVKELIDPTLFAGTTKLNEWNLNVDPFMINHTQKIRIPVSGKGYCPRTIFVSYNETPFIIHNLSWVYRTLYTR